MLPKRAQLCKISPPRPICKVTLPKRAQLYIFCNLYVRNVIKGAHLYVRFCNLYVRNVTNLSVPEYRYVDINHRSVQVELLIDLLQLPDYRL